MAVPTTLGDLQTRIGALQVEISELTQGARTLGSGTSTQARAASELSSELATMRKYIDPASKPQFATLKARLS